MKRRTFVNAAVPLTALSATARLTGRSISDNHQSNELYELRTYEIRFGGNRQILMTYLNEVLHPAMQEEGVNKFMMFTELGMSDPAKVWLLISYPNSEIYVNCQLLDSNASFLKASRSYDSNPHTSPIFNRYESWLLYAFDGMPQMEVPIDNPQLFELRTYEGVDEDAVRRKVKMFDVEELQLFDKVGLHSVFFGKMIAGPYRPCLTYMLCYKDMEERQAAWARFLDHPDWNTMKVKEEYSNTVSNIRKVFLKPV